MGCCPPVPLTVMADLGTKASLSPTAEAEDRVAHKPGAGLGDAQIHYSGHRLEYAYEA